MTTLSNGKILNLEFFSAKQRQLAVGQTGRAAHGNEPPPTALACFESALLRALQIRMNPQLPIDALREPCPRTFQTLAALESDALQAVLGII
jgi:hypothetical protein